MDEEELETIKHYLCDCLSLLRKRSVHFGKPFFEFIDLPEVRVKEITGFIKDKGLFNDSNKVPTN